jgi:uncharacterized protein (DUF1015 family)
VVGGYVRWWRQISRAFGAGGAYVGGAIMLSVQPFAALRPRSDLAWRVCELPYDVMSLEEARAMAGDNALSFLRVSRPEIELGAGIDPHAAEVYERGRENLRSLIRDGVLVQDERPFYYIYRQIMGEHAQAGVVAAASCDQYKGGVIRKHELTRPDKEDDRTRHIEVVEAQTGPVFLVYRAVPEITGIMERVMEGEADVDFTASDGVRHTAWTIREVELMKAMRAGFERLGGAYIADGHHRSAAAARVNEKRGGAAGSGRFLAVLFPHDQVQILGYHRVLKDLNGRTPAELVEAMKGVCEVERAGDGRPGRRRELRLRVGGGWYRLRFREDRDGLRDPVGGLDATLLQGEVLGPLFGINDPRTSERIQFVGGIRGIGELERLVREGKGACAFAMYPTGIEELMAVADAGGIMPPKSTWFEPKLRDGLFSYVLAEGGRVRAG